MAIPAIFRGASRAASAITLACASSLAFAQAPAGGEPPLAWTAGDKGLKWGPCPEFPRDR